MRIAGAIDLVRTRSCCTTTDDGQLGICAVSTHNKNVLLTFMALDVLYVVREIYSVAIAFVVDKLFAGTNGASYSPSSTGTAL